jgi:O-acetyl-ADP-ribose deacetylase (regulator of RNase III)
MNIKYQKGDATLPQFDKTIIVHCCNDIGAWGAGFVIPLAAQFPRAKQMYKEWSTGKSLKDDLGRSAPFALGEVQFVKVSKDTYVANMIGQHSTYTENGIPPIRYSAIQAGLFQISKIAKQLGASVQMPKMGAGLAGGDWEKIESLITRELCDKEIEVLVLTID